MARRVLPAEAGSSARAGLRRRAPRHRRDQRLVLLAAAPVQLPGLVRADAGRVRVQRQGAAVRDAHEEAARRRGPRWPTSSPTACWRCATSSDRSCGSCRRRSATTPSGWRRSSPSCPSRRGEAAWQARRHDERVAERCLTDIDADRPLRHAVEVRHKSFAVPAFLDQLREHGVADRRGGHRRQVAEDHRGDGGIRVRTAARRQGALRQRLHARQRSPTGRPPSGRGPTPAGTPTSTSTTT